MFTKTYRQAIADSMNYALNQYANTLIIGQGVSDFKGIFGTTTGLAQKYPDRVIESPLAEDSIAGICIGASLNGMYPINTHIRADFGLLTFNQLINLAAKYKYMFGGLFEIPMMVRMIIGRSWGQGAQHSQSLQSLLSHIPGLVVVMPSTAQSVLESYKYAIDKFKGPVIFLEHRLLYELQFEIAQKKMPNPLFGSIMVRTGTDVTVVATSVMVLEVKRAAEFLSKNGISIEIIDMHSISHPDIEMIINSVKKTGKLLVVDTSWTRFGVVSEINRIINEFDPSILKSRMRGMGMQPSPCPTSKSLEDIFYPNLRDIVIEVLSLVGNYHFDDSNLPNRQSMVDFFKHFKGPF